MTYQSQKTASIISLNSACRKRIEDTAKSLKSFTDQLILGFTDVHSRKERNLAIDQIPALETTVQGKLDNEDMILRTVVLHHKDCIYDLMHISRPKNFKTQETTFSQFTSSLKLHEK